MIKRRSTWRLCVVVSVSLAVVIVALYCTYFPHQAEGEVKMYRLLAGDPEVRLKGITVDDKEVALNEESLRYLESAIANATREGGPSGSYSFEFFFADGGSYWVRGDNTDNGISISMPLDARIEYGHQTHRIVFPKPLPEDIRRMCDRLGIHIRIPRPWQDWHLGPEDEWSPELEGE